MEEQKQSWDPNFSLCLCFICCWLFELSAALSYFGWCYITKTFDICIRESHRLVRVLFAALLSDPRCHLEGSVGARGLSRAQLGPSSHHACFMSISFPCVSRQSLCVCESSSWYVHSCKCSFSWQAILPGICHSISCPRPPPLLTRRATRG